MSDTLRKALVALGGFLALWLGANYLLPFLLPFALGLGIALAAEPAVGFGVSRLRLSRKVAAGIGVSLTLLLLAGLLSLLGALTVRELGSLTRVLPQAQNTLEKSMVMAEDFLIGLANKLPDKARVYATDRVLELFDDGTVLLDQVSQRVPGMITGVLGKIPNGALTLGTGLLSGFMLSVRLPRLKAKLAAKIPPSFRDKVLPALRQMGASLAGWLKAQGKLMAITCLILAAGLTVLQVPYGFLWAAVIALVDAIPILGTGTVLIPWAVISLLQSQTFRGIGLLVLYGACLLSRTVLEPKFLGKHLGLDPLLTLVFLYVGYRIWGFWGMVIAPILAAAVRSLQPAEG